MAEFMSQDDINEMLSQIGESAELKSNDGEDNAYTSNTFYHEDKIFKYNKPPVQKFATNYKSPVIKREDVLYNPHLRDETVSRRTPVYSLEAFQALKQ